MENLIKKSVKIIDSQVWLCQSVKVNSEYHPAFNAETINAALSKNTSAIKVSIEQRMKQCITRLESAIASNTIYDIQETQE